MGPCYLQWYRDDYPFNKTSGEVAADELGAEKLIEGWPIARLHFASNREAEKMWKHMLDNYGINACTHFPTEAKLLPEES
jgi:hypothetical protein